MSLIGGAAVCLVMAWLIATLVIQFRPMSTWYPTLNQLGLLPTWKFYTQGNGTFDLTIEMRGQFADGELGAWTPVRLPLRKPWHALWYPEQFPNAVYWIATDSLARRAARGAPAEAGTSLAYAAILREVHRAAASTPGCPEHQFRVVRTPSSGVDENREIVFVSDFHAL